MSASKDPVVQARGYVGAALNALGVADRILPDDHPQRGKLESALEKVDRLHRKLGEQ